MKERKIGISVGNADRVPTPEIVRLLAKIGFGGIIDWKNREAACRLPPVRGAEF